MSSHLCALSSARAVSQFKYKRASLEGPLHCFLHRFFGLHSMGNTMECEIADLAAGGHRVSVQ